MPPKKPDASGQSLLAFAVEPLWKQKLLTYCILTGADVNQTDVVLKKRLYVFQVIGGSGDGKRTTMLKIRYIRKHIVDGEAIDEVEASTDTEIWEMSKCLLQPPSLVAIPNISIPSKFPIPHPLSPSSDPPPQPPPFLRDRGPVRDHGQGVRGVRTLPHCA